MAGRRTLHDTVVKNFVTECMKKIRPVHWNYSLVINTEKGIVNIFRVTSIHKYGNFVTNYTDEITLECMCNTKDFFDKIVPSENDLQCTLIATQYSETGNFEIDNSTPKIRKYRGLLSNIPERGITESTGQGKEIPNPDLTYTTFTIQLIDADILKLKMATFACMFNKTNPFEALCMALDGVGSDYGIVGINRPVNPDVTSLRMMIVPRGTLIKDIAHYIQKTYGIYNHGIGLYVHMIDEEYYWCLYPIFNNKRYQKEKDKLTITVVDQNYNNMENGNQKRTYFVDDKNVNVYVTAEVDIKKDRYNELNNSTGVQYMNLKELVDKTRTDIAPNQVYKDGASALSSMDFVGRQDGIQNLKQVYRQTMNTANLASEVVGNQGDYVNLTWRYADPDLIKPGMPVKIRYIGTDNIKTLYGTLHEYHAAYALPQASPLETAMVCNVMMNIYVTDEEPS